MDIAFVSNVVYPFVKGGAEKRIHEIGRRLVASGHDVTVYGRHFWDGPSRTTHAGMQLRAVAPEADLYAGDRRSITEAIGFSARLVPALRRALRRTSHDVVVVSVFPYFPVLGAVVATLDRGTPIVTTWHEVWLEYWNDYLGPTAPLGKLVERVCARVPQHPVAVSELTADRLATIGPPRNAITVIPNGIDVEAVRTAPRPSERGQAGYDVLFVGRLVADKNVDLLLEAFDDACEETDATLGIIGDGPELERLQAQQQAMTHPDRVTFLGFVDSDTDVLGYMRDAQVFASLSTREGFGIVFVEAMAADCTVVTANHPNSNASAVVGDAGFSVPPNRPDVTEALTNALRGQRPETDPVCRASDFDWDRIAEQAEAHYQQVAGIDTSQTGHQ